MSDVVTGEAVALDLRVARFPSRLLAAGIDLFAQFALLWLLTLGVSLTPDSAAGAAVAILVVVAVLVVYPVTFETVWRGRTPGKAALGLRVVREDGGPISFRHALVRGLVGAFVERPGLLFPGIGVCIGVFTQLINSQGKRLGDIAAGTLVLQERVPAKVGYVPQMPPPLAGWAAQLDLTRLDDRLALSARQFLGRAGQLDVSAREQLGSRLVRAVAAATTPPPPAGTPGWAYLSAVLAERRRREEARLAARRSAAVPWQEARPSASPPPAAAPTTTAAAPADTPFTLPS